ncbi:MAG: peptide-methionine (R)-S-oxide reductase MsrB [Planctomycetaceae bacterium]
MLSRSGIQSDAGMIALMTVVGFLAASCVAAAPPKSQPKSNAQPAADSPPSDANPNDKVVKTEAEWRKLLTKEQFRVTRLKGTEPAYQNAYWKSKKDGTYQCVCCQRTLFDSRTKFDSGTGWPSFWQPVEKDAVAYHEDRGEAEVSMEVVCSRCDAHLGHVFGDGPQPTGMRFCMNSAAMKFVPREKPAKSGAAAK